MTTGGLVVTSGEKRFRFSCPGVTGATGFGCLTVGRFSPAGRMGDAVISSPTNREQPLDFFLPRIAQLLDLLGSQLAAFVDQIDLASGKATEILHPLHLCRIGLLVFRRFVFRFPLPTFQNGFFCGNLLFLRLISVSFGFLANEPL